ncbi:MAG: transporter [Desulfuromonadales bacterium]|jgi:hypothetical protein
MKKLIIILFAGLVLQWASSARAILIDPYDNFLPPDGFYGLLYGNYYHAGQLNDGDGHKAANIDLTAKVTVLRGLYYHHVGKIPLAFQLIIPVGEVKETKLLNEKSSGLGDITFGPAVFLYNNEQSNTYLSYWFYVTAPSGEYDKNQTINFGQDNWYFEHQLAFEQIWKGFVYDMNLNYYHHLKDSDSDYKAPQRFEVEASLAYQVTDKLVLGVNGGGYWDLQDAKVQDTPVDGTKAERLQFGPTLGYQVTDKLGVNLRWTHDMVSENDTEGDDVWLRLAYAF